jgi:hypothetical protein
MVEHLDTHKKRTKEFFFFLHLYPYSYLIYVGFHFHLYLTPHTFDQVKLNYP